MRRLVLLAALLGALVALGAPAAPPAQAKTVRAFAVGPSFDVAWVRSTATFRAHLEALARDVRRHRRGPADRRRPVQTARDLVTLPEDLGLMAAFTGERGAGARSADSLVGAILGLLGSYAPVSAYYTARYPDLATRPLLTRALAVSLTDTFVRTGVETFAKLADDLDAYVVAGGTLVRSWKVVCTSRSTYRPPPGAGACDEVDPAKVALLRAPDEPSRTYAYEATDARPSTVALVFDPDGRLVSRVDKAYLTPIELPGQLDLVPGDASGVQVVPTPVGRLGIVTSKDAWMPDVLDKLDARRADLLVQPEFFVGDTLRTSGPWAPDNLRGSGLSALLRLPSLDAYVMPELVGNVFDFSADAQQVVAVKPRGLAAPRGKLAGQPLQPGILAVSPTVVRDTGPTIAARRTALGRAGEAQGPTSTTPCRSARRPAACRGGHWEGVTWADVEVLRAPTARGAPAGARPARGVTASQALAPSGRPQRNVTLAAGTGRVRYAAFQERRGGRDVVLVARSADAGRRWGTPVVVSRSAREQWWPSLAAGPGGELWVAWQDGTRVLVARSDDGGRRFAAPLRVTGDGAQWRPSVAATGSGRAVLAWVDERERSPSDRLPVAAVRSAVVTPAGVGASQRLDRTDATADLAAELDHAWAPEVAADGGRVAVTWLDFRTYDWRVAVRRSTDGGATWAPEEAVGGIPSDVESLAKDPAIAMGPGGPLVAFASWAKDPDWRRPMRLHDVVLAGPDAGGALGAPRQVDGDGAAFTEAFHPSLARSARGTLVAFQDHARGDADVQLVRVGSAPARPVRVDDDGRRRGSQAMRPAVTAAGDAAVVAWEDDRAGPPQVRLARVDLRRLG